MENWELVARKTAAIDPMFSKLESEYPGTVDAAIQNARPAALEFTGDFVRKAKALKAEILATDLTAADMQQLIAFFETPLGRRLAARFQDRDNSPDLTDKMADKIANGDSGGITAADLNAAIKKRSTVVLKEMSADELLAVAKFEREPSTKKFGMAGAKADAAILEMINHPDAKLVAKIGDAATDGAVKFVEAKKSARK